MAFALNQARRGLENKLFSFGYLIGRKGRMMSDFTPEEEQAINDWMFSQEPPPMTAEEYDIELKAAVVEEFVSAANRLVGALDEMEVLGIVGNEFNDLRSIASQAACVFSGDRDDGRTLEDLP